MKQKKGILSGQIACSQIAAWSPSVKQSILRMSRLPKGKRKHALTLIVTSLAHFYHPTRLSRPISWVRLYISQSGSVVRISRLGWANSIRLQKLQVLREYRAMLPNTSLKIVSLTVSPRTGSVYGTLKISQKDHRWRQNFLYSYRSPLTGEVLTTTRGLSQPRATTNSYSLATIQRKSGRRVKGGN